MLKMTPAREQDRGLYSCLASNEAGEAQRKFSVEVLGKTQSMFLGASEPLPAGVLLERAEIEEAGPCFPCIIRTWALRTGRQSVNQTLAVEV